MDIQRYRSHTILLVADGWEKRWANDIDGSALAAQPGKSQGRPMKSPGSNTPIAQNGLPSLRSPEGPCPSRPNLSRPPDDTSAFKAQFHAAKRARNATRRTSPIGVARALKPPRDIGARRAEDSDDLVSSTARRRIRAPHVT
jgi:hypothetical protein